MTYVGVTTEFCLPIVADYETVVFETRFYKNTDTEGVEIVSTEFTNFTPELDERLVLLPLSDGISVASIEPEGGGTPCSKGTECNPDEICLNGRCVSKIATIFVEIVPNQELPESAIDFDVVQQGSNDQRGNLANKGKNDAGKVMYRGVFTIEREDKVFNSDGLARVNPTFPSSCDNANNQSVGISDSYTRDVFNEAGEDLTVEEIEAVDSLAEFRQTTTGRIGASLDIRSSEDPYFIFGDPNYSLKKEDGNRLGVPFQVSQAEILTGDPLVEAVCVRRECGPGLVWNPGACGCVSVGN
jgi:hypothetical protein